MVRCGSTYTILLWPFFQALSVCLLLCMVHVGARPLQEHERPVGKSYHAENQQDDDQGKDGVSKMRSPVDAVLSMDRSKRSTFFMQSSVFIDDSGKETASFDADGEKADDPGVHAQRSNAVEGGRRPYGEKPSDGVGQTRSFMENGDPTHGENPKNRFGQTSSSKLMEGGGSIHDEKLGNRFGQMGVSIKGVEVGGGGSPYHQHEPTILRVEDLDPITRAIHEKLEKEAIEKRLEQEEPEKPSEQFPVRPIRIRGDGISEEEYRKKQLTADSLFKFVRPNHDFLVRYLDAENFLEAFAHLYYIPEEDFRELNKHEDMKARRQAFLSYWLSPHFLSDDSDKDEPLKDVGLEFKLRWAYQMYRLFKAFRPGLFPEVPFRDDVLAGPMVIRSQILPRNYNTSSCRWQVIDNILEHKTHFIQNMELTSDIEDFLSGLSTNFDNIVDRRVRKRFSYAPQLHEDDITLERWGRDLRKGFLLHCLDYADESKKLEFLMMMKEKQPGVFSGEPLSNLMAEFALTLNAESCVQPPKAASLPGYHVGENTTLFSELELSGGFVNGPGEDFQGPHIWIRCDRPDVRRRLEYSSEEPPTQSKPDKDPKRPNFQLPMVVTGEWLVEVKSPTVWFNVSDGGEPTEFNDGVAEILFLTDPMPARNFVKLEMRKFREGASMRTGEVAVKVRNRLEELLTIVLRFHTDSEDHFVFDVISKEHTNQT